MIYPCSHTSDWWKQHVRCVCCGAAYSDEEADHIADKLISEGNVPGAEADRNDGREPGDTRDEESLEDHNIQGLGAFRDVFDADGEQ